MSVVPAGESAAKGAHAAAISAEARALAVAASPLVLTNLGNMLLGMVDVAVVGRLGQSALAGAGLGNAIFFNVALFGLGVLFGLDPLVAQALGAGERPKAARVFSSGVALALGLSVPLAIVILLLGHSVDQLGAPSDAVAPAREYVMARVFSLPPFLLLMTVRAYLQAHGRTRSLVVGVVAANVVNLPVAIVLTLGAPAVGVPGYGVVGAGLAATVATLVQLAVSAAPVRALFREDAGSDGRARPVAELARGVLRLGLPIGGQIALEAGSFSIAAFLVGRFGSAALAAHQIVLSYVSATFQIALGVGAATSVRVGRAVGAGDRAHARRAGLVGIAAGAGVMVLGAITFLWVPGALARTMTDVEGVVTTAISFFLVAACFQLSDGVQTVAQGALRGAGDTRGPFLINLAGHYGLGLPLGIALAWSAGLGAVGLWWGLSLGLTAVAALLTVRFLVLSSRPIARA